MDEYEKMCDFANGCLNINFENIENAEQLLIALEENEHKIDENYERLIKILGESGD